MSENYDKKNDHGYNIIMWFLVIEFIAIAIFIGISFVDVCEFYLGLPL